MAFILEVILVLAVIIILDTSSLFSCDIIFDITPKDNERIRWEVLPHYIPNYTIISFPTSTILGQVRQI